MYENVFTFSTNFDPEQAARVAAANNVTPARASSFWTFIGFSFKNFHPIIVPSETYNIIFRIFELIW